MDNSLWEVTRHDGGEHHQFRGNFQEMIAHINQLHRITGMQYGAHEVPA